MTDPTIPARVEALMEEVSWRTDAEATALQMRAIFTRLVTARVTAEQERDARLQVPASRLALLRILSEMPEEAFGWFLSAARSPRLAVGPIARIWPAGSGKTSESLAAIDRIRAIADACEIRWRDVAIWPPQKAD